MKPTLRWTLTGLAALAAIWFFLGETVSLTLEPEINGDTLIVKGTTDLPDGALITYEVTSNKPRQTLEETSRFRYEGSARVKDGRYAAEVDLSDWPQGSIRIWAAFQAMRRNTVEQPEAILERFGEMGEKLRGPNVTRSGRWKQVELTVTLER